MKKRNDSSFIGLQSTTTFLYWMFSAKSTRQFFFVILECVSVWGFFFFSFSTYLSATNTIQPVVFVFCEGGLFRVGVFEADVEVTRFNDLNGGSMSSLSFLSHSWHPILLSRTINTRRANTHLPIYIHIYVRTSTYIFTF